jgi:Short C-terminal domain
MRHCIDAQRANGVLTDAEFDTQKARILSS